MNLIFINCNITLNNMLINVLSMFYCLLMFHNFRILRNTVIRNFLPYFDDSKSRLDDRLILKYFKHFDII